MAARAAAVLALLSAAALWTVGLVVALPPNALRLLVGLVGGAGLAALLLPTRRSWTRLAGLVGLMALVLFLAAFFHKPEGPLAVVRRVPTPDAPLERLRLVDWNVLHGYPGLVDQRRRLERQIEALRTLDADVIVLQEAWSIQGHGDMAARLAAELGDDLSYDLSYDLVYAPANGSRRLIGFEEGSAVLSRLPIREARRLDLRPRRPPWEARIAIHAVLDLGGGETLTVVATHLTNRHPDVAAAQARHLAARLPDAGPTVVAGDLNATSDSAAARPFLDRGYVDLVPGGIDHVFWRGDARGWRVAGARWVLEPGDPTGEADLSDHPAILVDLVRIH